MILVIDKVEDLVDFDEQFRLVGDEDTDVGLHCRFCERGGAPVAFYSTNPDAHHYWKHIDDMIIVDTITKLLQAGITHSTKCVPAI